MEEFHAVLSAIPLSWSTVVFWRSGKWGGRSYLSDHRRSDQKELLLFSWGGLNHAEILGSELPTE